MAITKNLDIFEFANEMKYVDFGFEQAKALFNYLYSASLDIDIEDVKKNYKCLEKPEGFDEDTETLKIAGIGIVNIVAILANFIVVNVRQS